MKVKGKDIAIMASGGIRFLDEKDITGRKVLEKSQAFAAVPTEAKEEDFARILYRQISSGITGSGTWKSTNFSESVLRKAIPMFEGKTVYKNHDTTVGEHVGTIGQAVWQDQTTNSQGVVIPSGVNAPFILDKIVHPVLVRELTSPYPPVKSVSIGVMFEWEASHDFEDEWQFSEMIGEKIDGVEVTRVATNIEQIFESSLVWEGADPYAKKIGSDGKVSLERAEYDKKHGFEKTVKEGTKEEQKEKIMQHKKILALFGVESLEEAEAKAEGVVLTAKEEYAKKDDVWKVKLADKIAELESAKKEVAELATAKATIASLETFAKHGKAAHEERVGEAKRLYIASLGADKQPSELMIQDIEASSYDVLAAKIEMFGGKVESQFTRTCNKCGCTDVSLKSSVQKDFKPEGERKEIPVSFMDELSKSKK